MATRLEQQIQARIEKLDKLKKLNIDTNPPRYTPTNHTSDLSQDDQELNIAGRILSIRGQGKISFIDIQDESGKLQLFASAKELKEAYKIVKLLDVGDYVGVEGISFTTKSGEQTLKLSKITFLSKALKPLPDTWSGLKDKEERFRKRYLDMIINPKVKKVLDKRWIIERGIREFLWSENYTEVETPILQNLYGGTNASPFLTHLNALGVDMYLRVAPELYLKRLIVGGYERVFEIARNFRNEGMDQTHQPEFTMLEFYESYADYHRIMDITEDMMKYLAKCVNGSLKIQIDSQEIDLSGKWPRITVDEALKKYLDIDWETITDTEIKKILKDNKFQIPGVYTRNKALFLIYDHLVTPKLIDPTWVIDYPIDVSPLSKSHREKQGRAERFEGYIGGKEICDGWSEIVSPVEQRERFENEQKNLKAGDDEAQPLDEDFLDALSYGCPPLGGIGIGIDRLTMFLTNTWSIREVIPFPLLKTKTSKAKASIKSVKSGSHPFSINQGVQEKFPGFSYAVTTIKGVTIKKNDEELKEKTKEVLKANILELSDISDMESIQAYRKVFKATGAWKLSRRPSPEALLRRISQGKGIYNVNTAVDAYNLAVVESRIGLGGFDVRKIVGDIELRFTQKGEKMLLLGDEKETETLEGEIAYADSEKLLTLDLNYRDIDATKITKDTNDIMLFADGAPGISEDDVVAALKKGANYIQQFCGGRIGKIQLVR